MKTASLFKVSLPNFLVFPENIQVKTERDRVQRKKKRKGGKFTFICFVVKVYANECVSYYGLHQKKKCKKFIVQDHTICLFEQMSMIQTI